MVFVLQLKNVKKITSYSKLLIMKKIVFLFSILILVGVELSAQSAFRFGFQLSPNFTWMANNERTINGNGSNLGLKVGVIGEKFLSAQDNYLLTFGIGFAFNQGGTLKHDIGGDFWPNSLEESDPLRGLPDGFPDGVNLKYGIQYIELPLGLKMRTQEFGYLRYYVEPAFTLGIRTQARGSVDGASGLSAEDIDIKKDVAFLNLSLGIGGGVEYSIGENLSLIGGLAFQSGFTDVSGDDGKQRGMGNEPPKEDSKAKINSLTIRIGVMF